MRVTRVLRLRAGENVIIFDDVQSQLIQLESPTFQNKKIITATLLEQTMHKQLKPRINLCIGLLKKDALQEVAYYAAAMGATHLVPVITSKVQRSWAGQKEEERLIKVMIAAAEQSKQFVLPKIENPLPFDQFITSPFCTTQDQSSIYFDVHGEPLLDQLNEHSVKQPSIITLFWGPEGGLVPQEIAALDQHGFSCTVLTPTVLRAVDAVAIGLGSFVSSLSR
ncbi:RsmE family RNA methyltransferase [Candidatus Dependentiae bacterium]|nr:RsmE family RNA methyltransferase [Candidatus Dependentiae bacterium]